MLDTVITKICDNDGNTIGFDMDETLMDVAIKSLADGNTYVPAIERVVYNFCPAKDENGAGVNTLVTVVYFVDGTKTTVRNCGGDKITTEDVEVKLSDGSRKLVTTASQESKETGLVHAIAKRVVCGYTGSGYGNFLKDTVAHAQCQDVNAAVARAECRIEASKPQPKPTKPKAEKRERLNETINSLGEVLGGLNKLFAELRGKRAARERSTRKPRR